MTEWPLCRLSQVWRRDKQTTPALSCGVTWLARHNPFKNLITAQHCETFSSLCLLNHRPLVAVIQGRVRWYTMILHEGADKYLVGEVACQDRFRRHVHRLCFCNTSLVSSPCSGLEEEVCLSTSSHGDFRCFFFFVPFHPVSELKGPCWHVMGWILAGWKGIPCLVAEQHRVGAAFKNSADLAWKWPPPQSALCVYASPRLVKINTLPGSRGTVSSLPHND